jgi:hypothetical protein
MTQTGVATFEWTYGVRKKAWIDGDYLFIEWNNPLFTGTSFTEKERVNLNTWEAHRWSDFVEESKKWKRFVLPDCDHPYYLWVKSLVIKARAEV